MHPFIATIILSASSAFGAPHPFLVVIDPGHGGSDHGATVVSHGKHYAEKDLVLDLGKSLKQQLRARGIRAVLTRRTDQEMELADRTAMANRLGAQVFVSLHMNSHRGKRAHQPQGIETYVLNHSSDKSSKRLANLENSVLQGSAADRTDDSHLALILKDLMLSGNLKENRRLACMVQTEVVRATSNRKNRRRQNRGVKEGLFYVLLGADMPSILVEAGFLNHPSDRSRIIVPKSRDRVAAAIARALGRYQSETQSTKRVSTASLGSCKIN